VPVVIGDLIEIEKPLYIAEFTTLGGGLRSWQLRDYHHGPDHGSGPIFITSEDAPGQTTLLTPFLELGIGDLSKLVFELESHDDSTVSFRYSRDGITVRKTYVLDDDSYSLRLRIQVENASNGPVDPTFGVWWPAALNGSQEFKEQSFVLLHQGGVEQTQLRAIGSGGFFDSFFGGGDEADPVYTGDVDWLGVQTTYFLGVLLPDNPARANARINTITSGKAGAAELWFPAVRLPPGQATDQEFRAYLGPKEQERLVALGGETIRSIDLGWSWIRPLVVGFGWLLAALYSIIPNYGIAIIVLTILVRVVTMPLTTKQMRSMERMRELQPKIKELQEKFGDDRQKQSEETMKLYRSEGVNPLGGCFPMLLQLPVFIGLFYALRSSIQLRQAPFVGWIDDLSAPETLFVLPGIDIPVRVLPLAMGISMVLQQKLTPQTAMDPAQARMMMTIMPVMMTVLFYQFPSGLVLYWFVSNVLAIAHQRWSGRRMRSAS
jgi:YidC/Oxa1 family membrane protein insertase